MTRNSRKARGKTQRGHRVSRETDEARRARLRALVPANHKHAPQWVLGRFPITAVCQDEHCEYELVADRYGGGWVTAAESKRLRKTTGKVKRA